jgi:hypothetical protein
VLHRSPHPSAPAVPPIRNDRLRHNELIASEPSNLTMNDVLYFVTEWGPGEQDDRTVVIVKAVDP